MALVVVAVQGFAQSYGGSISESTSSMGHVIEYMATAFLPLNIYQKPTGNITAALNLTRLKLPPVRGLKHIEQCKHG